MSWHPTLNHALAATNPELIPLFPLGWNLRYGETIRFVKNGVFVSVYRDLNGLYENAITYATKCTDFVQVLNFEG